MAGARNKIDMDAIEKLAENIKRTGNGARQAQIRFVECASVDWDNKTMDAKGASDGVEYLDIILGFGYTDIKPVVGSLCLIGIIDGQEVVTFLINAEEVELVETKAEKIVFNGGENFGLVKVKELTEKLNVLEKEINSLKSVFSAWVPSPQDGGAALKGGVGQWAGSQLKTTRQKDIENVDIEH